MKLLVYISGEGLDMQRLMGDKHTRSGTLYIDRAVSVSEVSACWHYSLTNLSAVLEPRYHILVNLRVESVFI
jgi:hypothetical protein